LEEIGPYHVEKEKLVTWECHYGWIKDYKLEGYGTSIDDQGELKIGYWKGNTYDGAND